MNNDKSKRPTQRKSKYFDIDEALRKSSCDWALTIHNCTESDKLSLKRLSKLAEDCCVCLRRNHYKESCLRAFFQFDTPKDLYSLQHEIGMRGTWGIPLKGDRSMRIWSTTGKIIVRKKCPNKNKPKFYQSKEHDKPPRRERETGTEHKLLAQVPEVSQTNNEHIHQKSTSFNHSQDDVTSGSKIVDHFNELYSRKLPQTLPITQNYFVYGNGSDELALQIANRLEEKYYVKDNSLFWDDYQNEKVVVVSGISTANASILSQLHLWMGKCPTKVPCRLWPIWINPVSVIVAATSPLDIIFKQFGGLYSMSNGLVEIVNAETTTIERLNVQKLNVLGTNNYSLSYNDLRWQLNAREGEEILRKQDSIKTENIGMKKGYEESEEDMLLNLDLNL